VVYHGRRAGLEDGDLLAGCMGGGLESDSFAPSGAGLVELRADVDSRSLWWAIIMSGLGSHFVKYDPADNPCWILRLISEQSSFGKQGPQYKSNKMVTT